MCNMYNLQVFIKQNNVLTTCMPNFKPQGLKIKDIYVIGLAPVGDNIRYDGKMVNNIFQQIIFIMRKKNQDTSYITKELYSYNYANYFVS